MASELLTKPSMTLQISPRMLGEISMEVESGRALFSLLRAREYFELDHPLFRSMIHKAKSRISDSTLMTILEKVERGALLNQLTDVEIETMHSNESSTTRFRPPIIGGKPKFSEKRYSMRLNTIRRQKGRT